MVEALTRYARAAWAYANYLAAEASSLGIEAAAVNEAYDRARQVDRLTREYSDEQTA